MAAILILKLTTYMPQYGMNLEDYYHMEELMAVCGDTQKNTQETSTQ